MLLTGLMVAPLCQAAPDDALAFRYGPHAGFEFVDTREKTLPAGAPQDAISENGLSFRVFYMDIVNNTNAGFDGTQGTQARAALVRTLRYLANVLNVNATLDVLVRPSTNSPSSSTLASAGTLWSLASGCQTGASLYRVLNGQKQFAGSEDIFVNMNFGHPWNFSSGAPSGSQFDFESVFLHEMLHGLGFASLLDSSGQGLGSGNTFSTFDRFVQRESAQRAQVNCSTSSFTGQTADLVSNNLSFTGSNAFSLYARGVRPGIYAPSPFNEGSSLSHWDTGNIAGGAVMEHAISAGVRRRQLAPVDIGALRDLGYVNAAAPDGYGNVRLIDTNGPGDGESDIAPRLATDGKGTWISVWHRGSEGILAARSLNGGDSWSTPGNLSAGFGGAGAQHIFPDIATDGNGNWICVWEFRPTSGAFRAYGARSTDNGATWSAPFPVFAGESPGPQIAADALGNWVCIARGIVAARSTNTGQTWTETTVLESSGDITISADGAGGFLCAGISDAEITGDCAQLKVVASISTNGGQQWSAPRILSASSEETSTLNFAPIATSYGAGRWLLAWNAVRVEGSDYARSFDFVRTDNAGVSWTAPRRLPGAGEGALTSTATGDIVLAYSGSETQGGTDPVETDIYVRRSNNFGATWSEAETLNDYADTDDLQDSDLYPVLATDGKGAWMCAWGSAFFGDDLDAVFATFEMDDLNPPTFTPPAVVPTTCDNGPSPNAFDVTDPVDLYGGDNENEPTSLETPRIACDGQGHCVAVITGKLSQERSDLDILALRSADDGATWLGPVPVTIDLHSDGEPNQDGDSDAQIATDGAGTWVCVWTSEYANRPLSGSDWGIHFARSTDNGATWSASAQLHPDANNDQVYDNTAALAADSKGVFHLLWRQGVNAAPFRYARSADGGLSWTAPITLGNAYAGGNFTPGPPRLAVGPDGQLMCAWAAFFSTAPNGERFRIAGMRSDDGGNTWSAPFRINSATATTNDVHRSPDLAYGNGAWVCVWEYQNANPFRTDTLWSRTADFGSTWTPQAAIFPDTFTERLQLQPSLSTNGDGTWICAISAKRPNQNNPAVDDYEVLLAASEDNGITWPTVGFGNSDYDADAFVDDRPSVAFSSNGKWPLLWERQIPGRTYMSAHITLAGRRSLSVTTAGAGTGEIRVNDALVSVPYSGLFEDGSNVRVSATATNGSTFAGWSGDLTNEFPSFSLSMGRSWNLTATFTPPVVKRTLTIAKGGSGTGQVQVQGTIFDLPYSGQFDSGTIVSVTAVPSGGSTFTGWSGAVTSTQPTISIGLAQNISITANFTAPTPKRTLTIAKGGSGTGQVQVQGATFDLPYSGQFDSGTIVSVTAVPNGGSTFTGWSGAVTSTQPTISIGLAQNISITANFSAPAPRRTLTITRGGTGLGSVRVQGAAEPLPYAGEFDSGTVVSLTALPVAGSTFTSWSGAVASTDATISLNLSQDLVLVANFSAPNAKKTLTISNSGAGEGTVQVQGVTQILPYSAQFDRGATVALTAVPAGGSTFGGWSGAVTGSQAGISVQLEDDAALTATFNKSVVKRTLSISKSGNGTGRVRVNGSSFTLPYSAEWDDGTAMSLEALPDSGATFNGWTGDLPSSNPAISFQMSRDRTLVAGFSQAQGTLKIGGIGLGSGRVEVNGSAQTLPYNGGHTAGSTVNLRALPDTGSTFGGWIGVDSSNGLNATVTIFGTKEISAIFDTEGGTAVQDIGRAVSYGNCWERLGALVVPGAKRVRVLLRNINIEDGMDQLFAGRFVNYQDDGNGTVLSVCCGDYETVSGARAEYQTAWYDGDTVYFLLDSDASTTGSFTVSRVEYEGTGATYRLDGALFNGNSAGECTVECDDAAGGCGGGPAPTNCIDLDSKAGAPLLEKADAVDATLTAAPEIAGVMPYPGLPAGKVWQLTPAAFFIEPVMVQVPLPEGGAAGDITIIYYSEAMGSWCRGENVEGWLAAPPEVVEVAGAAELQLLVNYGGTFQILSLAPPPRDAAAGAMVLVSALVAAVSWVRHRGRRLDRPE